MDGGEAAGTALVKSLRSEIRDHLRRERWDIGVVVMVLDGWVGRMDTGMGMSMGVSMAMAMVRLDVEMYGFDIPYYGDEECMFV